MTPKEVARETRLQRAYERLGTNKPKCACCGESNPFCLESHHLSGRAFGDERVILCRNCHRKLSDDQKDHPKPIDSTPTLAEKVAHFLIGLADLLVLVAAYCREQAAKLLEAITGAQASQEPAP